MEKELANYGPIQLDPKAYRFFPTGSHLHNDRQINENIVFKKRCKVFLLWSDHP